VGGEITLGGVGADRANHLAVLDHGDPEIQAEGGNQHDQRADQNSSLKQWRIFRSGAQHVRPQLLATLPYWLTPTPQHKAAELVPACLYGIYFVDFHLYVAVTLMQFPVWLQDGKWPPEGKLSSSSISPRGFFAATAYLPMVKKVLRGGELCFAF
jgi:hypothetical protein